MDDLWLNSLAECVQHKITGKDWIIVYGLPWITTSNPVSTIRYVINRVDTKSDRAKSPSNCKLGIVIHASTDVQNYKFTLV